MVGLHGYKRKNKGQKFMDSIYENDWELHNFLKIVKLQLCQHTFMGDFWKGRISLSFLLFCWRV